ncbi:MAG: APC family permease [Clostridia bacterium]|nr:APC family permease [Clostridia bacterium]
MSDIQINQPKTGSKIEEKYELKRDINWTGAFWVASGVPALVLFSIGGIAATIGTPSWLVWVLSVMIGFSQSFTYAEIAGLFPNKSGGASVYGAIAWVRYNKYVAPLSTWCNWFAWSPVLAIGTGLAAGYILTALFPADALVNTWQLTLIDLNFLKDDLTLRIDATFIIGSLILLLVFGAQHYGILRAAKIQMIMAIVALLPLILIGLIPLLTGDVVKGNFAPFVPISGAWNLEGWQLFIGGMFIAAWSTYAFETSICYTREFKDPKRDTFKAILYSGLLCIFVFTIVPLSFQGALGLEGMLEPGIVEGSGVAQAMAKMVGGGAFVANLIVIMLILALVLAVMTSMAGSARTLYQASVDGWLPKYLSKVNKHGAPTNAMWSDLGFNLILLMMSDYLFVLAISNTGYIIFNFLNLNAGWIHRIDNSHVERPWRAPTFLIGFNTFLAFLNVVFLGIGANVWGKGTLLSGIIFAVLIIPVFLYRHHITDKSKYPEKMLEDLQLTNDNLGEKRAGWLPHITVAAGITLAVVSNIIFS